MASASRNTENLRGAEALVSVDRFSNSEGAEGSDILAVALQLVGQELLIYHLRHHGTSKLDQQNCHMTQRPRHLLAPITDSVSTVRGW